MDALPVSLRRLCLKATHTCLPDPSRPFPASPEPISNVPIGRGTRQRFPGRHVISLKGRLSLRLISWLGPQIQWKATGNFLTVRNGDGVGRLSSIMWGHP